MIGYDAIPRYCWLQGFHTTWRTVSRTICVCVVSICWQPCLIGKQHPVFEVLVKSHEEYSCIYGLRQVLIILLLFPFILDTRMVVEWPLFFWILFNMVFQTDHSAFFWHRCGFLSFFRRHLLAVFQRDSFRFPCFSEAMGDDGMSTMNVAKPRGCTQLLALNVARSLSFVLFSIVILSIYNFWELDDSPVNLTSSLFWKSNPAFRNFTPRLARSGSTCLPHSKSCESWKATGETEPKTIACLE